MPILFLLMGVGILVQYAIIRFLKHQAAYQPIYNLSPESHQVKSKTPSFGGVGILLAVWIGYLILDNYSVQTLWVLTVFSAYSLLGFVDDLLSLVKGKNKGLSAKQKFLLQWVIAIALLLIHAISIETLLFWNYMVIAFLFVATSNATNLTDGVDGLLGTLSLASLFGILIAAHLTGNSELAPLIITVILAIGAFLVMNWHPAKIFMGDTGSLGIGALLVALSTLIDVRLIIWTTGIYILETLSVIVQVAVFKRTKKRVFLMSPLHHHFELLGLSETKIVCLFTVIHTMIIVIGLGLGL